MKSTRIFGITILKWNTELSEVKLLVQHCIADEYGQNEDRSLGLNDSGTQVFAHRFHLSPIKHFIMPKDGDVLYQ